MALQILVVDDNADITSLLSDIISMENHAVTVAGTGQEAKTCVGDRQFDLAFCDITLPDISGWEVIQHLNTTSPQTAVVIISGHGEAVTEDNGNSSRIDSVLKKPFKIDEVQSVIHKYSTN